MRMEVVPASKDELVEHYGDYIAKLVHQHGRLIPAQDVADVTASIMTAIIAADVIGQFNPGHQISHGGQTYQANFRTFLTSHVLVRLRGQRDKVGRRDKREVLLCDQPADETGTRWIEMHGQVAEDDHSRIEVAETCTQARAYLESLPVRGKCDLAAVFDVVAGETAAGDDDHLTRAIAQRFGVAGTTALSWLRKMREAVQESVTAPPPPAYPIDHAGMTLTTRQVRDAIALLRATRATNVIIPLRNAGHPLAKGPLRWYMAFACEEQAAYPEIRCPKGTTRKHADHIKRAVIHRLERMVGDIPESEQVPAQPEPSPAPTLREALEAELWHLTTDPQRVDTALANILSLVEQSS